MKKTILILGLVFLCGTLAIAQKTIGKADYEHLVDYANCQYVMAFIEKNDAGKTYITDTYEKSVKPQLEVASLENLDKTLCYSKLVSLLSNNNPAKQLAKKINTRKSKYDEYRDDYALIYALGTTGWHNIDLSQTATIIQNDILAKYEHADKISSVVSEAEIVKTQTIQTSTQVEELQAQLNQLQQQYDSLKNDSRVFDIQKSDIWIQIIIIIVVIAMYVRILVNQKKELSLDNDKTKLKQIVKELVLNSSELKDKFVLKNDNLFYSKNQAFNLTEKDFDAIVDEACKRLSEKEIQQEQPQSSRNKLNEKFFKTKNGKILIEELPNSTESSFKVLNINNNEADFEYCGSIVNTDFFNDVCIFENNPESVPNRTKIFTTQNGRVSFRDGKWEVIRKAKIKFI
jgi:hypothetical protein